MIRPFRHARVIALPLLAAALLSLGGCRLYREDRCWIPPEQYLIARDLFIQTGSLDLVQQSLEAQQWRTCRVNEALYRLQKEFDVLPEELPPPAPAPAPATAAPATAQ